MGDLLLGDGDGGSKGGDGGGGANNTPPVNTPPTDLPEFLKGIDSTLAVEPSLKNMKDLNSLVKSFVHAQKSIGSDKIIIPKKDASPEQWKEVFTKLGLPNKEEYKINRGEKAVLDEKFYSKAAELGHELGILPHQMSGFITKLEEDAVAARDAHLSSIKTQQEEAVANLKKEWGESFDAKIFNAREVIKKFGSEEDAKFIQESGLSSNPSFVKFIEKIGATMKEAKIIEGKDSNNSPADFKADLDSIMKDKNHPYWNKDHIGHEAAKKQVSELFTKVY